MFGKSQNPKMEDPRWPIFVAVITSVADLNGNLFGRVIYTPSVIVIACILSCEIIERGGGGGGSASLRSKKKKKTV